MDNEYNILKKELNRLYWIKDESYTTDETNNNDKIIYYEKDGLLRFPSTLIKLCDDNPYWVDFVHLITTHDSMTSNEYFIVNLHELLLSVDDLIIKYEEENKI